MNKFFKIPILYTGVIDGELITAESLFAMQQQLHETYLPLTIEHDIRKPPIGRIVSTEIVELEDENLLLQGEAEVFEPSDDLSQILNTQKSVKIDVKDIATFQVAYNREVSGFAAQKLRSELDIIASQSLENREYSTDIQSVIVISFGVFAVSNIAAGFFKKMGSDIYDRVKNSLQQYYSRDSKNTNQEELLNLQYLVKSDLGKNVEINVILTNPSQDDIENAFTHLPKDIENLTKKLPIEKYNVCRIVVEYQVSKLKILYLLRADCVPILFKLYEQ